MKKFLNSKDQSLEAYVNLDVKTGKNLTFDAFDVNKRHTLK